MASTPARRIPATSPAATLSVAIVGLHCASCVGRVEGAIGAVPGVQAVAVNLATGRAQVDFARRDPDLATLAQAVARSGFDVATQTHTQAIEGLHFPTFTGMA
ncbi:MAG: heavy-metal-associated domain-containing protein, partial [Candidatus Competibacterales bacterium]